MTKPSLLNEFSGSISGSEAKNLAILANAKWQSALVSAAVRHEGIDLDAICMRYSSIANEFISRLDMNIEDPRTLNIAYQACIGPASAEIKSTGKLSDDWLTAYIQVLTSKPIPEAEHSLPFSSASSLALSLSNHYSELFATSNEFSFLRSAIEIVNHAHDIIETSATRSSTQLCPENEDKTVYYQNQLNCHRRIFISCYMAEASKWQSLLKTQPDIILLYPNGIPLQGVDNRFQEQIESLENIMGISRQQTSTVRRPTV